jgi:hypothetical protein
MFSARISIHLVIEVFERFIDGLTQPDSIQPGKPLGNSFLVRNVFFAQDVDERARKLHRKT